MRSPQVRAIRVRQSLACAGGAVLLTSLSSLAFVSPAKGKPLTPVTPQTVAVSSECDIRMTLPEVVVRAGRG
jgi:hypothetical protein